jgi:hypothetical protein
MAINNDFDMTVKNLQDYIIINNNAMKKLYEILATSNLPAPIDPKIIKDVKMQCTKDFNYFKKGI